jgi:hypothetical protein
MRDLGRAIIEGWRQRVGGTSRILQSEDDEEQ